MESRVRTVPLMLTTHPCLKMKAPGAPTTTEASLQYVCMKASDIDTQNPAKRKDARIDKAKVVGQMFFMSHHKFDQKIRSFH